MVCRLATCCEISLRRRSPGGRKDNALHRRSLRDNSDGRFALFAVNSEKIAALCTYRRDFRFVDALAVQFSH